MRPFALAVTTALATVAISAAAARGSSRSRSAWRSRLPPSISFMVKNGCPWYSPTS